MDVTTLCQRFHLEPPFCLALVGAEGKTTALFALARSITGVYHQPVIVTTTTRLPVAQSRQANVMLSVQTRSDLQALKDSQLQGVVFLHSALVESQFLAGPPMELLPEIIAWCSSSGITLLIEADSARGLPVKAPDVHEPAIPPHVDGVCVVAGLSALGKPLTAENVHQPGLFSALSGLPLGQVISWDGLLRVLCHPQGGLKGIPPQARKFLLLNQADSIGQEFPLEDQITGVLESYDTVLLASLKNSQLCAAYPRRAGVVLAAGASQRFGSPKQLLDWKGVPLVCWVAQKALSARLSPVLVVTGAHAEPVEAALAGLPVQMMNNPDWQQGQSASIRTGIAALPSSVGAAIILLVDQPLVPLELLRALLERHAETGADLVAPRFQGRRANPVLFDRRTFASLRSLHGDVGGRALFHPSFAYEIAWVPWQDASLLADIDTLEDYHNLLKQL